MQPPSAIIFINDSITTATLGVLSTDTGVQPNNTVSGNTPYPSTVGGIDVQLQVYETMWFDEFNARVAADPNYPTSIHLNGLRILVILPNFHCHTNRDLADIVIFVKQGVASIEKCKFGPPGWSLDVQRLNIWNLVNGPKSNRYCAQPFPGYLPPPQTQTPENPRPHEHLKPHFPEGLGYLELFGTEAAQAPAAQHGPQTGAFGEQIDGEESFAEGDDDLSGV